MQCGTPCRRSALLVAAVAAGVALAAPVPPATPVVPPSFAATVNISAYADGQSNWAIQRLYFAQPSKVRVRGPGTAAVRVNVRARARERGRLRGRV